MKRKQVSSVLSAALEGEWQERRQAKHEAKKKRRAESTISQKKYEHRKRRMEMKKASQRRGRGK